jgi:hypothetical protein
LLYPDRGMITISIMLANIMQGVDNTILNVATVGESFPRTAVVLG